MSFLLERDALNGKSGNGFMTIDGENHEMFGLKKFQADAEFQESDFKVVGTNLVQKKTTGVTLGGSMTIYYGTPHFLKLLQQYLKTGKLPYFTIQITNEDESVSVGTQTVVFYNVKFLRGTFEEWCVPSCFFLVMRDDINVVSFVDRKGYNFRHFRIFPSFHRFTLSIIYSDNKVADINACSIDNILCICDVDCFHMQLTYTIFVG